MALYIAYTALTTMSIAHSLTSLFRKRSCWSPWLFRLQASVLQSPSLEVHLDWAVFLWTCKCRSVLVMPLRVTYGCIVKEVRSPSNSYYSYSFHVESLLCIISYYLFFMFSFVLNITVILPIIYYCWFIAFITIIFFTLQCTLQAKHQITMWH